MARHFWIYPQRVMVHVHIICIYAFKGLSAVGRLQDGYAIHIDFIGIIWINVNFSEVISVGIIQIIQKAVVGFLPRFSAIGAFVNLGANYGRIEQGAVGIFQIFRQILWFYRPNLKRQPHPWF